VGHVHASPTRGDATPLLSSLQFLPRDDEQHIKGARSWSWSRDHLNFWGPSNIFGTAEVRVEKFCTQAISTVSLEMTNHH